MHDGVGKFLPHSSSFAHWSTCGAQLPLGLGSDLSQNNKLGEGLCCTTLWYFSLSP